MEAREIDEQRSKVLGKKMRLKGFSPGHPFVCIAVLEECSGTTRDLAFGYLISLLGRMLFRKPSYSAPSSGLEAKDRHFSITTIMQQEIPILLFVPAAGSFLRDWFQVYSLAEKIAGGCSLRT